ncbi:TBC1 domain family member 19 [Labeo rohita]|uniref:TBC1 domain family member 19 n=1 Tax=Labeo rohita TaxID=84645 RepID=A0ABQ8MHQ5_LABRO|nr:TBC1 domain family member 19 [Labeo rohita]
MSEPCVEDSVSCRVCCHLPGYGGLSCDAAGLTDARRKSHRHHIKIMIMLDESAELSVSITQIVQRLKGTHLHSQLEKQAKECLHKPEIKLETLKDDVRRLLKASGWERKLQNAVYRELHILPPPGHPRAPPEHTKEPLAYMCKAQRPVTEQKELTNKWNEMGTDEPDLSKFRPVYAPKDFLEVLVGLRNPNNERSEDLTVRSHWGLIQVSLNIHLFESEHIHIGKKVVSEQDSAAAQQYSRQGCPTGLRAQLWSLILNTTNDPEDITQYEQLKARVIHHDLLVDNLIYKDVKLTASNDDYYFVFEDYLYQVSKSGSEQSAVVYPPNGVIPFHGFSMYVAPLCFLYNEPSKLYSVFREMYIRYFFRLHSISSHPSGIVSLCLQFERLLQTHLPQLFYHLREIGAQPLRIAFKWIVRAFSGYLSTDQLLLLWDRILGYDSLEIVAVLAAAVFAFRAENLMEVTSLASAEAVLADLSTLKVMPLLQIFLFATSV